MTRILIACEYSGTVRRAFTARGHDAWSCDLLPAEDGSNHHYRGDVRDILGHAKSGRETMPTPLIVSQGKVPGRGAVH